MMRCQLELGCSKLRWYTATCTGVLNTVHRFYGPAVLVLAVTTVVKLPSLPGG